MLQQILLLPPAKGDHHEHFDKGKGIFVKNVHKICCNTVHEAHYGLFLLNPSLEGSLLFDERIKVVCQISLQELCHEIKLKYKDTFSFTFDEEAVKNS